MIMRPIRKQLKPCFEPTPQLHLSHFSSRFLLYRRKQHDN